MDGIEFLRYFSGQAAVGYASVSGGNDADVGGCRLASQRQKPFQAIADRLNDKPCAESRIIIAADRQTYLPALEAWLLDHGVVELAYLSQGLEGSVFVAYVDDASTPCLAFRIGLSDAGRIDLAHNRPWCPLVLQPHSKALVVHWYKSELSLELLPLVKIVPEYTPHGFDRFINDCVLRGTPFVVSGNRDWGGLADGTPVCVDPGNLNFRTPALAKEHRQEQFSPAWQQEIMGVIDENCRRNGPSSPFSWCVRSSEGCFISKQQYLHPNPMLRGRGQKVIRLEMPML